MQCNIRSNGTERQSIAVIDEMADLLARQKLVPFFGAGISRQHLGLAAAELALEMAQRLGVPADTALAELADEFEEEFGPEAFIGFLRERLVVEKLDDAKVPAHRLLLSLSPGILYTPNQDNLFELTAAHYGRPYRRMVTHQDFSDAMPGERLLYKYHGDLDHPETLVFGKRSYLERMMVENHPLDIRLQSDLLGKRLLFLGYSFRDENVAKLLDSVKRVFNGTMPPSYLIAFEYDSQMEELHKAYGIRIIDPQQLYPDAATSAEAFERCLKALCDSTVAIQAERGLQDLFRGQKINPRVITEYEVEAVARTVEEAPFDAAVNAFRGTFDHALVPESLHGRAVEIFRDLVERVDPVSDDQMSALKNALFQFYLPPALAAAAVASVMAACNRRPHSGFDWVTSLVCPALPDEGTPVAAAMAVAMLRDRGEVITDNFRSRATFWFLGVDKSPSQVRDSVRRMMTEIWPGGQNPLEGLNLPIKGFHKIVADITAQWPKQFRVPDK